jgi:hypothetical protein
LPFNTVDKNHQITKKIQIQACKKERSAMTYGDENFKKEPSIRNSFGSLEIAALIRVLALSEQEANAGKLKPLAEVMGRLRNKQSRRLPHPSSGHSAR